MLQMVPTDKLSEKILSYICDRKISIAEFCRRAKVCDGTVKKALERERIASQPYAKLDRFLLGWEGSKPRPVTFKKTEGGYVFVYPYDCRFLPPFEREIAEKSARGFIIMGQQYYIERNFLFPLGEPKTFGEE